MDPRPHRGIVGAVRPRSASSRGGVIPICWYCGTGTWNGELITQPDGNLLHEGCQQKAERDYPDRVVCDAELADAKVRWQDQRDWEDDAGAWRA